MELNNIIFSISILCFGYLLHKYSLFFLKDFKFNYLLDNQFKKPQAFHDISTHRLGGIIIYILFILTLLYLFFYNNIILYEYLSFCTLFFFLGLRQPVKFGVLAGSTGIGYRWSFEHNDRERKRRREYSSPVNLKIYCVK